MIDKFETQCKGKQDCEFTFEKADLPQDQCSSFFLQGKNDDWDYMLIASCSDGSIDYAGSVVVTKGLIGVVVVMFDLVTTFFFWCSLLAMKKF